MLIIHQAVLVLVTTCTKMLTNCIILKYSLCIVYLKSGVSRACSRPEPSRVPCRPLPNFKIQIHSFQREANIDSYLIYSLCYICCWVNQHNPTFRGRDFTNPTATARSPSFLRWPQLPSKARTTHEMPPSTR